MEELSISNINAKHLAWITKGVRSNYPNYASMDEFLQGKHFAALLIHAASQGNGEYILSRSILDKLLRDDVAQELTDSEITESIVKACTSTGIKTRYEPSMLGSTWKFSWYDEN